MTDRVHYDPHPHRRLAFDAHRNRLWLALSERLMVMETKVKSELQTIEVSTPCTAQSVTVLW
jgi:predicted Rossmann fold nucleotide-binding protein DprA/Smf involved in DNA uptake